MPTIEDLDARLTLIEAYVAQIQSDMVTRHQMSILAYQYDQSLDAATNNFVSLKARIDAITSKLVSLGKGVAATASYHHSQGSPAIQWIINHSLDNQFPHAVFVDTSNISIQPVSIEYTSTGQLRANFATAQAGSAIISKVA